MIWNWQQKDWPHFTCDEETLEPLERKFLQGSGLLFGAFKHIDNDEKTQRARRYYE